MGDDFPWTHDLRHLIDRLNDVGLPLPPSLGAIRMLGPWAVEFRYGETIDDPLDRAQATTLTSDVIEWAATRVVAAEPFWTQHVRAGDRSAGIIRVPPASKHVFPPQPCQLAVVLRGADLGMVRWDPRLGPDRERSGVIGVGREAATHLAEGEVLRITRIDGGVRLD